MKGFAALFLVFLSIGFYTSAQVKISGKVVDRKNNSPMPFVSIVFQNTSQGTISNSKGEFFCTVDTSLSKILRFSFIGYENKWMSVFLPSPMTVLMDQVPLNLPEVVVLAGKRSWVTDLVSKAVKNIRKNKSVLDTRGFLSLETTLDQSNPLEVMEAFYQCQSAPGKGVTISGLKNGRFGIMPIENLLFINKNPTDIIQNLHLFEKKDYDLPKIPFSMDTREMKKKFRFRIDTLINNEKSAIAIISFLPKSNSNTHFSGTIWIDTTTYIIHKVVLTCNHAKIYPFHPIDSTHRISGVSMKFEVTYKDIDNGWQAHDFIRFEYRMYYTTKIRTYDVHSNCLLLLYDYDHYFILPYYISAPNLTDYGKILSLPFNPLFWERNYIIPKTQTSLDYEQFFQQKGITVNYEETNKRNVFLQPHVIFWQPGFHLSWDLIGKKNPGWILFADSKKRRLNEDEIMTLKYFLDFQVFLDFNIEPDTCYWQSRSMLFLDNSFYEPFRDSLALKASDLEFKITELYKLRLEHRLDSVLKIGCNPEHVLNIYDKLVKQFDGMRWLYRKEVKRGQDNLAYDTWEKRIDLRIRREKENRSKDFK